MNFFSLSTLILLVSAGAILGLVGQWKSLSLGEVDALNSSIFASQEIQDTVILDDLPPPDDTYTPDQRPYS